VYGSYSGDGIEVDNVDQPGSSVFVEEAWLAGSDTDLFEDALDNTNVQLPDFHHQGSLQTGQVAVNVIGGANGTHVGVRDTGTMAATAADKSPKSPERALSFTPAPYWP
jgi:hypothetical protein